MQERDAFLFRADSGGFIDESDASGPASLESSVEIVDGETDVMDARTTLLDESCDRRIRRFCFEKLDERLAGGDSGDARAVSIVERDLWEIEDVAVERQNLVENAYRDADMGETRSTRGGWHAHGFWPRERENLIRFRVGQSPTVWEELKCRMR